MTSFISTCISIAFVFSTMYTLAFYYYQGTNTAYGATPMDESAINTNFGIFAVLGGILDFISWLSPWALVKAFLIYAMTQTPDLYNLIDMLLLRPIGWIIAGIEINYLISKIPTISGE